MPMLAVYSYQAYLHYVLGKNLYIRNPKPELSTAENFLYMLKGTGKYTSEEDHTDICMIYQARTEEVISTLHYTCCYISDYT